MADPWLGQHWHVEAKWEGGLVAQTYCFESLDAAAEEHKKLTADNLMLEDGGNFLVCTSPGKRADCVEAKRG